MEIQNKKKTIEELLAKQLFFQREYSIYHLEYEQEMKFYKAVQKGDVELVQKLMLPLKNEKLGYLSKNSLQNLKYHLVVLISMLTRFSIEGGMNPESAYTLSDIYIQQVDQLSSEEATEAIHKKIIFDSQNVWQKLHKKQDYRKKL